MKKIVFVDDDPDIQDIIKLIFKKADYDLTVLSSGDALLKNSYTLPDIIFLDKQLPGTDGLEICRRLKSGEKTKDVAIIMVSANPDIKSLARSAGADEAIEKPFDMYYLRAIVAKYAG